jgi:hypothetical protein
MRAPVAATTRRALALEVKAKRLRHLEVPDLIGLARIAAGLVLLVIQSAR